MKNKLRTVILLLLVTVSIRNMAQDEIYRMELGAGIGGCFYLGDANSKPFANLSGMGGIVARYIFNPRMALKGDLAWGQIRGGTGNIFFPQDPNSETQDGGQAGSCSFKRNLIDLSVQFELNFWGYGIGQGYEGYSRITPCLLIGGGLTFAPKPVDLNVGFHIPVGIGVKYKVKPRLNIGLEWSIRFTTSDALDVSNTQGVILKEPYGISSPGFKNKDCYSFTMLTLTYDLFPKCANCNNIKYVF